MSRQQYVNFRTLPRKYAVAFSISIPFIALGLQWVLWPYISPFVWFLFFPSVFFSARIGGRIGGLVSTALSALIVWYFFIPPRLSFAIANPYNIFSVGIFLLMGYLFSDVQARLSSAGEKLRQSLSESREANEKISVLYDQVKELDRLKTHFFSNVSHELRTPLTLIVGSIKKISSDRLLTEETRNDIDVAERNARFLYRKINDLLDISKLEAGRMVPHYSEIDISYPSRVIASQFETLAQIRDISYTVDIQDSISAQTDVEKFQRIILNLLSNAFKFTPEKGKITLSLRRNDDLLELQVRDSGPGIPEDKRSLVFERFSQVESHDARMHGGSGLGLAIVKEFTTMLSGTIHVSDAPEGGAFFCATFPLSAPEGTVVETQPILLEEDVRQQAVEELSFESAANRSEISGINAGGFLVLVVEDNRDMNRFIVSSLAGKFRVVSAFTGIDGYLKAKELHPDLIITDEMMPELSGGDMVRRLVSDHSRTPVPIIMLTAKADDDLRREMFQCGIRDFINKPFEMEELLSRIDNIRLETGRHRKALDESESRFRFLAENVADVIWIMDCETNRFRYISPSVVQLCGFTDEEIVARTLSDILVPESYAFINTVWRDRMKSFNKYLVRSYVDELQQYSSSGSVIWTETTTRYVENPQTGHLEIYGVSRDIMERKHSEEKIRNALAERETLLRELYHRTKNNMNVIIGMLTLRAAHNDSKELSDVFKEIENKIRVMSLVHEKLYKSHNLTYIDLKEYFQEIISLLIQGYTVSSEDISVSLKMDPMSASIDVSMPCGLILNELLSNTIKHAFPGGAKGHVVITLNHEADGMTEFVFSDDGIGVPENFDFKNQPTLGLQTVCMIASHQLQGTIEFTSKKGVSCLIRFKNNFSPKEVVNA